MTDREIADIEHAGRNVFAWSAPVAAPAQERMDPLGRLLVAFVPAAGVITFAALLLAAL